MTATDEIRRKVDLVEVVGESVALKPSGQNFKANCPFHNERTPSFYVFPERQSWHCFGACAAGGDVFSYIMRREGMAFPEALALLAARAGVQLDTRQGQRERSGRLDELRQVNRAAAMFFHEALLKAAEAQGARDHLAKRGISTETIEDYRLGYSAESGAGLARSLASQGHKEEALLAAGLLRQRNEAPGTYPFFRGRLMVPIQDAKGDYVGFGARALDDAKPKYLNTGQTALFDKSSILFGLHRGAEAIKKERLAVLVEGYMDVLMAHQHGFKNVVAAMGTALSERQVSALRRLGSTFVLALDPDAAGDEATLRSLETSWKVLDLPARPSAAAVLTGPDTAKDLVLKVMDLPRGVDPDDMIRQDPEGWPLRVQAATPVIDYVFAALAKRSDLSTTRGKADLTRRLAPFILQSSNVYEQNERMQKLAGLLREDVQVVKRALLDASISRSTQGPRRARAAPMPDSKAPAHDQPESYCLAALLRFPELKEAVSSLSAEHFSSTPFRIIFGLLAEGLQEEEVRDRLPDGLEEDLEALLRYEGIPTSTYRDREEGIKGCVRRLNERKAKLEAQALAAMIDKDPLSALELQAAAEDIRGQLLRNSGKSG